MIQPEVSVVIPCYNGERFLEQQLTQLVEQKDAPRFEVIVSDNGSTDRSKEYALSFADKLLISVVDSSQQQGICYARNIGVENARGTFILFCDVDDYVDQRWVSEMYRALTVSGADIAVGMLFHSDINSPEVLKAYEIHENSRINREAPVFIPQRELPAFSGYLPTVAGCNFAVRRETYLAVGGMDTAFVGGSEETDFTWRAIEHGAKLVAAPRALVHYRLRDTFRGIYKQQFKYQETKVLLWQRYKDKGMTGPSIKYSCLESLRAIKSLVKTKDLPTARVLGGNLGALFGMLKYRLNPGIVKVFSSSIDQISRYRH